MANTPVRLYIRSAAGYCTPPKKLIDLPTGQTYYLVWFEGARKRTRSAGHFSDAAQVALINMRATCTYLVKVLVKQFLSLPRQVCLPFVEAWFCGDPGMPYEPHRSNYRTNARLIWLNVNCSKARQSHGEPEPAWLHPGRKRADFSGGAASESGNSCRICAGDCAI